MAYWLLFFALTVLVLAYFRAGIRATSLALAAATLFFGLFGNSPLLFLLLALGGIIVLVPLNLPVLRQEWLSRPLFASLKRALARLDRDQLAAIGTGAAGWEAELFDGRPEWSRFHTDYVARLSPDERALLEGPVSEFCARFARDPQTPQATQRMRAYGLFGVGIESAQGGIGVSALGQAAALGWISAAIGAEVALKPGNQSRLAWIALLQRHGTAAQQTRWLPDFAAGVGCHGVLGDIVGSAVVDIGPDGAMLRLHTDLSLPADAEIAGLCVDIVDPKRRLNAGEHPGPTHLLLPAAMLRDATQPLIVDFDAVIGGRERIGAAAADSAECQALADAIAPAAIHAGTATALALGAGSVSRLRPPFEEPRFETPSAQAALAMLAAQAYSAQALAAATARAIDLGATPLAPGAFARTLALQQARRCSAAATDLGLDRSGLAATIAALDVVGRDAAEPALPARAHTYSTAVLRSHRAFMQTLAASQTANPAQALERFDDALWLHIGHLFTSAAQALVLGLTAGSALFGENTPTASYQRRINRYSAALAFCGDVALSVLGSELASRTSITALRGVREVLRRSVTTWLGDALAHLYLASAALRQFERGSANPSERAVVELICTEAFGAVEEAFDKLLRHLSSPTVAWLTRRIVMPLGRSRRTPSEMTQRAAAAQLQSDGALRARLGLRSGLPIDASHWPTIEAAVAAQAEGEAIEQRLRNAAPASRHVPSRIAELLASGAIDASEANRLHDWYRAYCAVWTEPKAATR